MSLRKKLLWSLTIALLHGIVGNWLAAYDVPIFIETLFMPYTFLAALSNFAGWDQLSYTLEAISFLFSWGCCYFLFLLFAKDSQPEVTADKNN